MKNFFGTALSQVGYSHIKKGKCCQDSSAYFHSKNYEAIVVCDGHGGEKHFRSEIGSKIAVEICKKTVEEFVKCISNRNDHNRLNELLSDFGKHLIFLWREKIREHYEQNPFLQNEEQLLDKTIFNDIQANPHIAYGTTLILIIACKDNLFIIKLGDGEVRLLKGNDVLSPILDDELTFGKTASLCNFDASEKLHSMVLPLKEVDCCIISTDGVINSFETVKHFENFCKTLSKEFNREEIAEFENELCEFLPLLSEQGSGDDVSIAILSHNEEKNTKKD